MQLFTRRAARSLYKNQRIKRWCFDVELIYLAKELHIPISEVPVQWREVPGEQQILHLSTMLLYDLFLGDLWGTWVNQGLSACRPSVHCILTVSHPDSYCCVAGSKIRVTSMINMAIELLAVLLGYKVFRRWTIKTEAEA